MLLGKKGEVRTLARAAISALGILCIALALIIVLVAGIVSVVFVFPLLLYRSVYAHSKRLKAIIPGRVYRSGQLTAVGFTDAHNQFGIHTFINVQDDFPDPDIELGYWNKRTIKESALCARLGVRYVHVPPDLVPRRELPEQRPQAIEQLLAVQ